MAIRNVRFCWLCGNKLWGNHKEELTIDLHSRTLHKSCAEIVKNEYNFKKDTNGAYHTLVWQTGYDYEDDEDETLT